MMYKGEIQEHKSSRNFPVQKIALPQAQGSRAKIREMGKSKNKIIKILCAVSYWLA